jgi:hypothetical protein
MKIALQLHGHLRNFSTCVEQFSLKIPGEIDVFIHTWSESDHNTQTWHRKNTTPNIVDHSQIDYIREIINVVDYEVEPQDSYPAELVELVDGNIIDLAGQIGKCKSFLQCNLLRANYEKSHGQYDLCIVSRPDILLLKEMNFLNFLIDEADKRSLFVASGIKSAFIDDLKYIGGADSLFMGSSLAVDALSQLQCKFDETFRNQEIVKWGPEHAFMKSAELCGLSVRLLHYHYWLHWVIERDSGLVSDVRKKMYY